MASAKRSHTVAVAAKRVEKKKERKRQRLSVKQEKRKKKASKKAAALEDGAAAAAAESAPAPQPYKPAVPSSLEEARDVLAGLSEDILASPSASFKQDTPPKGFEHVVGLPSKIRQLYDVASLSCAVAASDEEGGEGDGAEAAEHPALAAERQLRAEKIGRLALLSCCAVFLDLIPSYRIRVLSADEWAERVSKEKRETRVYERALLLHYKTYLNLLERCFGGTREDLAAAAARCLCELLLRAPHFNFRSHLVKFVAKHANEGGERSAADVCVDTLRKIFAQQSERGVVALEAVQATAKIIHARVKASHTVRPELLRSYLSLPLKIHPEEAEAAKALTQANKKQKKKTKKKEAENSAHQQLVMEREEDVRRDLEEAAGGPQGTATLARCQADMLSNIVLVYLRVLQGFRENVPICKGMLVAAALQGLSKFGHLINADTVMDVLGMLKGILKREMDDMILQDETYAPAPSGTSPPAGLDMEGSLNCILTAFKILAGPGGEALPFDTQEYIMPFYALLGSIGTQGAVRNTSLILQCLSLAFHRRHVQTSSVRTAAFAKRLLTAATCAPSSGAVPLVAAARRLLDGDASARQILESEEEAVTATGPYDPGCLDPDRSNPLATSAWELALLRFHWRPDMKRQAAEAADEKPLVVKFGKEEEPELLLRQCQKREGKCYIDLKMSKKMHPLLNGMKGKGSKRWKRQQKQWKFITPAAPLKRESELNFF